MNQIAPAFPGVADRELSALILTLHETEWRAESLTDGELDTVADSEGRIFLLREAHEQLRQRESTRQAGILNALPANIALLDCHGVIISVNEAWRQFADASIVHAPGHALGLNYLDICDSARGDHSAQAHAVAQGIRAVLGDQSGEYSIEYSCHSPTQERWFHMMVTPLTADTTDGVVVMHLDISKRKQADAAQEALTRSAEQRERVLSTTLASMDDFAYIYDRRGRFLYANPPLLDLWGITLAEAVGKNFLDLGYPDALAEKLQLQVEQVFLTGKNLSDETPYTGAAGQLGYYEYIFSPVITPGGFVEFVVGTSRDISERKYAEVALQRQELEQRELAEQLALERSRLIDAQRIGKIGSWTTDIASSTIMWSDETHHIHETDPASFLPTHQAFLALVHPDDRENVDAVFRRSLAHHSPCQVEHRLLLPDGRIKFIAERWQVFLDEEHKVLRAVGTCQDITDRKIADEIVRQRVIELERFHRLSVGRELQMIGLKKQINEMAMKLGHESPYDLTFLARNQ